jgi:molybdate transport system regulatory protein
MKTTARNQFVGTITRIQAGPVTAEVALRLRGGQDVTATLTSASAAAMGLRQGQEAMALVKASAVVLVTDFAGYTLSARNQLAGTVSRIERGAVTTVVGLDLPGGEALTATVTNDAVTALGLQTGQVATAVFKAYAVLLAVKSSA